MDTDNNIQNNDNDVQTEREESKKNSSPKKPKKRLKVKKQKPSAEPQSKPGVISTMIAMLRGASEDNPVTKEEILAELCKRFPDREKVKMKSTLNMQVPTGLRIEKGLEVSSAYTDDGKGKGYWLEPDQKTKQEKKAEAEAKPAKKKSKKRKAVAAE